MFPDVASHGINSAGIATFHTGFKVVLTILMFPFANYLGKAFRIFHQGRAGKRRGRKGRGDCHPAASGFPLSLIEPAFAIENAIHEVVHMGTITQEKYGAGF